MFFFGIIATGLLAKLNSFVLPFSSLSDLNATNVPTMSMDGRDLTPVSSPVLIACLAVGTVVTVGGGFLLHKVFTKQNSPQNTTMSELNNDNVIPLPEEEEEEAGFDTTAAMESNVGYDPELGLKNDRGNIEDAAAARKTRKAKEEEKIRATGRRVNMMFPGIKVSDLREYKAGGFIPKAASLIPGRIDQLKGDLNYHVDRTIHEMDPEERRRLHMRGHEAELCVALGMNQKLVEIKFRAHAAFEKETGIQIKTPVLCMIKHLIENIDNENPFGEVNDEPRVEKVYKGQKWLDYLGIRLKKGDVWNTLQQVERLANINKDSLLHGTTSRALQGILKNDGHVNKSIGNHDFGEGVYCMMGQPGHALSWAIGMNWPDFKDIKDSKEKEDYRSLENKNPAVVLFRNEEKFDVDNPGKTKVFHVGFSRYPNTQSFILKRLKTPYRTAYQNQKLWADSRKRWHHFVQVARISRNGYVPDGYSVFHGTLHDASTTHLTDTGGVPIEDGDGWQQICFRGDVLEDVVGEEKVFIEFHFDWQSWVQKVDTEADYESLQQEADDTCKDYKPASVKKKENNGKRGGK